MPVVDTMNTAALARYCSVKSKTIKSGAATRRTPTSGKNIRASLRVASCQISRACWGCPSRAACAIRTINTLPAEAATSSTNGICKHPTAYTANVAASNRYETMY